MYCKVQVRCCIGFCEIFSIINFTTLELDYWPTRNGDTSFTSKVNYKMSWALFPLTSEYRVIKWKPQLAIWPVVDGTHHQVWQLEFGPLVPTRWKDSSLSSTCSMACTYLHTHRNIHTYNKFLKFFKSNMLICIEHWICPLCSRQSTMCLKCILAFNLQKTCKAYYYAQCTGRQFRVTEEFFRITYLPGKEPSLALEYLVVRQCFFSTALHTFKLYFLRAASGLLCGERGTLFS